MIAFDKHFQHTHFPAASEAEWRAALDKVLQNKALADKVLYTETNAPTGNDPAAQPGYAPFTRGTDSVASRIKSKASQDPAPVWHIASHIQPARYSLPSQAMQPADIEADIATDLQNGATAILLDLTVPDKTALATASDLEKLLTPLCKHILPQAAYLLLRPSLYGIDAVKPVLDILTKTHELAKAQGQEKTATICFDYDPLGTVATYGAMHDTTHDATQDMIEAIAMIEHWQALLDARKANPNLRFMTISSLPYHNAGADEVTELACMLATLVFYMRLLEQAGLPPADALPHITLTLAADTDFFATIAKLRAARTLWNQIATACHCPAIPPQLHAEGSMRGFSTADPWVNILRATIATCAAGIGGANIITTPPSTIVAEQDNALARRLARNTQLILQEESHIGRVIDAAGGSWYVEQKTQDFCHAAWDLFQQIETKGGMDKALESGFITDHIATLADKHKTAIATREKPILGVSAFPNLAEAVLQPRPIYGAGALAEARPARDFEVLRLTAQAAPTRPKVFLATIGKQARFLPRAHFAVDLFAAGGIDSSMSAGGTDISAIVKEFAHANTQFAVLCGTDEAYQTYAADLAQALRKAGANPIWLTGQKKLADIDNHIDNYIFPMCDALALLKQAHVVLGLGDNKQGVGNE
ncbi:MAG: methylmalonyl-CoA mutase family protein [Alphaproteobacteria bacterium]|nr:methylmalonyl-CoA mutase family protein [Alphaproteobacteria bacterium]